MNYISNELDHLDEIDKLLETNKINPRRNLEIRIQYKN